LDYFADRNCIGFVRSGNWEHPGLAVVITNGSSENKHGSQSMEPACRSGSNPSDSAIHSIRMNVGKVSDLYKALGQNSWCPLGT